MQQHRKERTVEFNPFAKEVEVQAATWNARSIQKDARRFEQFVREMRIRCGLEVSHG